MGQYPAQTGPVHGWVAVFFSHYVHLSIIKIFTCDIIFGGIGVDFRGCDSSVVSPV